MSQNSSESMIGKSIFRCVDCRSIFRFDEMKQFSMDSVISLDYNDVIHCSNNLTIPPIIRVVSNIPFCPYCQGNLIMLHNRLLDKFNEYNLFQRQNGTPPFPTLTSFLEYVLEVFESSQRKM